MANLPVSGAVNTTRVLAAEVVPYPSRRYAWYMTALLTAAYLLSFVDRQILSLLAEPIKRDLGLSDTQLGWLMGPAFALFYVTLGLPIGWLADRANRKNLVGAGVTFWCVMTAACGLARGYAQLFVARMGVGVGESVLTPTAYSLIGDYFPREEQGRAMGLFKSGISLGLGVAYLVGAQVVSWSSTAPPLRVPGFGEMEAWRVGFAIVGLPGILVAALLFAAREPPRRGRVAAGDSIVATLRYIAARRQAFGGLILGMGITTLLGYAWFWLPSLFVRTWGWSIADMSWAYGSILLVCGPGGALFGGWLGTHWIRQGRPNGTYLACMLSLGVMLATSIAVPLMPTGAAAVAMLVPATVAGAMASSTGAASLVLAAPSQIRAQSAAVYMLSMNLLGLTLGPVSVGLLNDHVFTSPDGIRYSLALVPALVGLPLLAVLISARGAYRRQVVEVAGENGT